MKPDTRNTNSALSTSSTSACLTPMKNRAYITTMLARPSFMPGKSPGITSVPSMKESAMASANSRPDRAMILKMFQMV